ncbi:uncharacterized protein Z519_09764 [Cladophialophora bantiana CBS 173.52]|uniref:Uncharacterized protein n=1 Tax=Cladophialophora bantiana (strain ATCC 10958 / CBS 173.52 / CDC B-1940 / NIH 8579) TaxID=1442370 RepID=A0A0D2H8N9_CLAB1|nr:uncharacterized protein Z519_09764 [Cladophialophora bantiana CBS 173.52]KIW89608.1 hypothetical protein Z519_09764 [Cladophialophora bantiana CBS 173.52]
MADIAESRLQFALNQGFATVVSLMSLSQGQTLEDGLGFARESAAEFCKVGQQTGVETTQKFEGTLECTGVEASAQAVRATRAASKANLVDMGLPVQTLPVAAAIHGEINLVGICRYANAIPRTSISFARQVRLEREYKIYQASSHTD